MRIYLDVCAWERERAYQFMLTNLALFTDPFCVSLTFNILLWEIGWGKEKEEVLSFSFFLSNSHSVHQSLCLYYSRQAIYLSHNFSLHKGFSSQTWKKRPFSRKDKMNSSGKVKFIFRNFLKSFSVLRFVFCSYFFPFVSSNCIIFLSIFLYLFSCYLSLSLGDTHIYNICTYT